MALKHKFVSTIPNGSDTTKVRPINWNDEHVFSGGALGSLLFRDTGASDGQGWVPAGAGVLAAAGAGQIPAFRALLASDIPQLDYASLANLPTLGDVASLNLGVLAGTVAEGNHLHTGVYEPVFSTLGVAKGGTGLDTFTIGDLLYASGASALSKLADVAAGSVLVSGGVGAAPAWSATPTLTSLTLGTVNLTGAGGQSIVGTVADEITFTTPTRNNSLTLTSYGSGTMLKYRSDAANHQLEIQGWDGTAYHVHTDFLSNLTSNELQLRTRDDGKGLRFQYPDSGPPFIQPSANEDAYETGVDADGDDLVISGGLSVGLGAPGRARFKAYKSAGVPATPFGTLATTRLDTTSTDSIWLYQNDSATAANPVQMSSRIRQTGTAWNGSAPEHISFFTEVLPVAAGTPTGAWQLGYFRGGNVPVYPMIVTHAGAMTLLAGINTGASIQSGDKLVAAASSSMQFNGRAQLESSGTELLEVYSNGRGKGVGFSVATDGTLLVRNKTQNADGQVAAASVRGNAVTFANRPATPVEGMLVAITDSSTNVWGATITGGGANHVLAYYNGTNWTVAGK